MGCEITFVGGRKIVLDDDGQLRFIRHLKARAGQTFVPMGDGSAIFFKNIMHFIPDGVLERSGPLDCIAEFVDGSRLPISIKEQAMIVDVVRGMTLFPQVILRSGIIVMRDNIAIIGPKDAKFFSEAKQEAVVVETPETPVDVEASKFAVDDKGKKWQCCDKQSLEYRYILGKGGMKMFTQQCTNCLKKTRFIARSEVPNPDTVLPVKEG